MGGFVDALVDNAGNWSAVVKVSSACRQNLTVTAWCMHTSGCRGQVTLPVDCCPTAAVVLVLKDSNGNQVGNEVMTVWPGVSRGTRRIYRGGGSTNIPAGLSVQLDDHRDGFGIAVAHFTGH